VDFAGLVERLRAEGRPSWLVHRAQHENRGPERFDWCRGAWNLGLFDGRWRVIRGWGLERTDEAFASEEAACAAIYERVIATGEVGVRALGLGELPLPAQRLVGFVGLGEVAERPGDRFVSGDAMALRVVSTPDGHRIDRPSAFPPAVGDTWFAGLSLDDAARVVMVVAGARVPRTPGVQSWGLPGTARVQAEEGLRRLREVALERIEEAYLGVPEGVLEPLGVPPALDLVTGGLVALAEARGLTLGSDGGPDEVYFDSASDGGFALGRTRDGFVVRHRGERSNDWDEIARSPHVADARRVLVERLRPRRLPPGFGEGRLGG